MRSRAACLPAAIAAVLVTAAAAPAPAPAPAPSAARDVRVPAYALKPGRMVDVGGHRLNLYCFGRGSPTVLMLSGGGWGAVAYARIQPRLARTTRVCAYDRAGAGFSDMGPRVPPPGQSTRDLEALVRAARLDGPFVLVGWSLGGMEARAFAYRHPAQVAGLVTIDGSVFDRQDSAREEPWARRTREMLARCRDAARAGRLETDEPLWVQCRPAINPLEAVPELSAALRPRTLDADLYDRHLNAFEQMDEEAKRLRAERRPMPPIPFRALVAGSHFPDPAKPRTEEEARGERRFVEASFDIVADWPGARMIVVPRTGHAIHLDDPDAVVETIEQVVAAARARAPSRR